MKAVITGASGLLGRAVADTFENSSWEGKNFCEMSVMYTSP
jgi:short-subunit dehydrogenase